jgi:hypothetical protein
LGTGYFFTLQILTVTKNITDVLLILQKLLNVYTNIITTSNNELSLYLEKEKYEGYIITYVRYPVTLISINHFLGLLKQHMGGHRFHNEDMEIVVYE